MWAKRLHKMLPLWGYDNQGIRAATDTCFCTSSPNHVAIQLTAVQGCRNRGLPLGSAATKACALAKRWGNTSLTCISVASQISRQELPAAVNSHEDPLPLTPKPLSRSLSLLLRNHQFQPLIVFEGLCVDFTLNVTVGIFSTTCPTWRLT